MENKILMQAGLIGTLIIVWAAASGPKVENWKLDLEGRVGTWVASKVQVPAPPVVIPSVATDCNSAVLEAKR